MEAATEAKQALNVLVTGAAYSAGYATVKALRRRGHTVVAAVQDADGAQALRQLGALPAYPDLQRASSLRSLLQMAEVNAIVHAAPQALAGIPHETRVDARATQDCADMANALAQALRSYPVPRIVALSFAYLYAESASAVTEDAANSKESAWQPLLSAEAALSQPHIQATILRAGAIYGGKSPATSELAAAIKRSQRVPSSEASTAWIHEDDLAQAIVALLEAPPPTGTAIFNAAAVKASPNAFAQALAESLGLPSLRFAGDGFIRRLRSPAPSERLLTRKTHINSDKLAQLLAWQPRHTSLASGLEATALAWRMQAAGRSADFYEKYEDLAAKAIAEISYDLPLPAPDPAPSAPKPAPKQPAPVAAKAKTSAAAGPAPWNESDAKREERRRRALERKAKRAAKQARN